MYTAINFKTKKALRLALADGQPVAVQPDRGMDCRNGEFFIEGPHSPAPHRWYAHVEVEHGLVVRVVS